MTLRGEVTFRSQLVTASDVTCQAARSGPGPIEYNQVTDIAVVRRGVFAVEQGDVTLLADPGSALVFGSGETFRVSHPADHGDRCTVLRFAPELVEEALGRVAMRAVRIGPTAEPHDVEQAILLLAKVAEAPQLRVSGVAERRAAQIRELLASDPGSDWRLDNLARAVHCSPYHLARQFRTATGTTIGAHLTNLRLTVAIERIERGENDLARLAADLGFASHSHLTARFRERVGRVPSELSKIVTAQRRNPT